MEPTLALREVKALLDAIEHGELFGGAPDDPCLRQRYETGVSLLTLAHRIAALGVCEAGREEPRTEGRAVHARLELIEDED